MKAFLNFFFFLASFISLKAEDGHDLWLRNHKANPVKVVCAKQSPTLDIAKKELEQSWLGKPGATVILDITTDKSIKGEGYKSLKEGDRVSFDVVKGPKGPAAENVRKLEE